MKNFIVRTITSVFFVAAIVTSFLNPRAMTLLFGIVTGMTIWEFAGLVNDRPFISINRFICTVSGVYLFLAMAGYNTLPIQVAEPPALNVTALSTENVTIYGIPGSYAEPFANENNITKMVMSELGEDPEVEEYSYTYDGKWPVSVTSNHSYSDEYNRSTYTRTTYFEYK